MAIEDKNQSRSRLWRDLSLTGLVALWFGLITLPIVGIKMGDEGVTWRLGPLVIAGLVLAGGLIWLGISRWKGFTNFISQRLLAPLHHTADQMAKPAVIKWETASILVLLAVIPWMLPAKHLNLAVDTGIYIILALGLNIVVGSAGLLVLGYAGFWAIGAYTYALASIMLGCPFWLGLPLAAAVTGLCGLIVGLPCLRLRGDYLAIVTLGFGELVRYLLKNLPGLTGGEKGLPNEYQTGAINHPQIFGWVLKQPIHYYYITFIMVVLTIIIIERLNSSRIGRAWIALREDELAATSMGINTTKLKILAFVISAVWAGFAGVLYTAKMNYITPEAFRFDQSALILAMVILGGMGNTFGVILGAVILYILPWFIRDQMPAFQDYRLLIYGATMVLMMLFRPQGLISSKRRQVELSSAEG
ncbi:MAG: branched-chain amino acid ABC transporter permease [Planctomycetes bacterium]|nr:branched-chain amino acid ABC transporter permease [Planctomycetota bacterium]